jgi:hypothetical protein
MADKVLIRARVIKFSFCSIFYKRETTEICESRAALTISVREMVDRYGTEVFGDEFAKERIVRPQSYDSSPTKLQKKHQ